MSGVPELDISSWGPRTWGVGEQYAQIYPWNPSEEKKAEARALFEANGYFVRLVPCPSCVGHFNRYARENPPDVDSREALVRWILRAHNKVNERNGKPTWSYEQVNRRFWGPSWRATFRAQQSREGYTPLQPAVGEEGDEPPVVWMTGSTVLAILGSAGLLVLIGILVYVLLRRKKGKGAGIIV